MPFYRVFVEGKNFLIKQKKGGNRYTALNESIKRASGNIIGILHADDFFYKNTHYGWTKNYIIFKISVIWALISNFTKKTHMISLTLKTQDE